MSIVEKKEILSNVSKISSIDGIGRLDLIVCLFVELAVVYHEAKFSSFLGTNMAGALYGLLQAAIKSFIKKIQLILQILLLVQGHSTVWELHRFGTGINFNFMCFRIALVKVPFDFWENTFMFLNKVIELVLAVWWDAGINCLGNVAQFVLVKLSDRKGFRLGADTIQPSIRNNFTESKRCVFVNSCVRVGFIL